MGFTSMLVLLLTHPVEFRTLVQFSLYHEQKRDITSQQEHPTSGWDRKSMRKCWEFLDMTSRSFSAVIKELDGDLARTICLFYLVLRGLDTIEDDMTIPDEVKQPLLRSFHIHTVTPGWNFSGNGPDEKDRQLLVEYHTVVEEFNRLNPEYRDVILSICEKMETGMADYAHQAASVSPTSSPSPSSSTTLVSPTPLSLSTIAEYDLYCHYVAGLVGEGLSGLWSASGKESAELASQLTLSNSMGLLLQKTNIIRDVHEDVCQARYFWPREVWQAYGFAEPRDFIVIDGEPEDSGRRERAQWVQSAMVLDAMRHACDALDYLRLLKNQSVFNFCAIPATMAMATLALCFMNGEMFMRNIKIRKAEAASLIMRSTNPREVAYLFRNYAREIHSKAIPADPNFLKIAVACGKIEQWAEHAYPSFVRVLSSNIGGGSKQVLDESDARARILHANEDRDRQLLRLRRVAQIRAGLPEGQREGDGQGPQAVQQGMPWEVMGYVAAAFAVVIGTTLSIIYAILWYVGEQ